MSASLIAPTPTRYIPPDTKVAEMIKTKMIWQMNNENGNAKLALP
jgi:hypothetical protein